MKVFVTVGTTLFADLINVISSNDTLDHLKKVLGCTHLKMQYGKGSIPASLQNYTKTDGNDSPFVLVTAYDFKPSLATDMKEADLIVCHAGAGTVMEVLQLEKPAVVVINRKLMDNHQQELANAFGQRGNLFVVEDPKELLEKECWERIKQFKPNKYEAGDKGEFVTVMNNFLGLSKRH